MRELRRMLQTVSLPVWHPHTRHLIGGTLVTPVHDLAAEVLVLPAEERARIFELLIASFEPKSSAQKAWLSLALRRREEVSSGNVAMIPGDEALARVRARICKLVTSPRRMPSPPQEGRVLPKASNQTDASRKARSTELIRVW